MTPEQKQAIKKYADAIAEILDADCEPGSLKTLEDIEIAVKEQVLSHVTPEIGFAWCNARRRRAKRDVSPDGDLSAIASAFSSTQLAERKQEEQRH